MPIVSATLAVIGGLALGWEKSFYGQAGGYLKKRGTTRIWGLIFLGFGVASQVESLRGFWIVFLSSVGAYYLASHFSEFIEKKWSDYRGRIPNCDVREELYNPNIRVFSIDTRDLPPACVETLFLRGGSNEQIKPKSARLGNVELKIRADGWLNDLDISIERNSRIAIALDVDDWASVTGYRIIGRWANDVLWVIDGDLKK